MVFHPSSLQGKSPNELTGNYFFQYRKRIPLKEKIDKRNQNPDIENCHCERGEAISPSKLRLPRTLRVLAMTGRSMLCRLYIGIWEKGVNLKLMQEYRGKYKGIAISNALYLKRLESSGRYFFTSVL